MSSPAPVNSRCASALAEQCRSAREEMGALLDARIEQIAASAGHNARQAAAEEFNRAARSLRRYENQEAWAAAVLDATAPFVERAALFLLAGLSIKAVKARNLDEGAAFAGLDVPIAQAPAIAAAAASGAVVALASSTELSAPVAALFGSAGAHCAVVPIVVWNRTIAILCAAADEPDTNALEAVAALASTALELRGAPPALEPAEAPFDLEKLRREAREIHLRARRFARVRVAEMQLRKPDAVRAGRAKKKLYLELKQDIDSGRDAFRQEFIAESSAMIDYLHLELVRTLAHDDAAVLGKDYPGPLVQAG